MLHYLEWLPMNPTTRHLPFPGLPPLHLCPEPQTRRTSATRTALRRAEVARASLAGTGPVHVVPAMEDMK